MGVLLNQRCRWDENPFHVGGSLRPFAEQHLLIIIASDWNLFVDEILLQLLK
jgi:hypothetical protein